MPKADHHLRFRRFAAMDVPDRIVDLRLHVLRRIGLQLLVILIHRPRDHVPPQPLRRLRLLVHEIRTGSPSPHRSAIRRWSARCPSTSRFFSHARPGTARTSCGSRPPPQHLADPRRRVGVFVLWSFPYISKSTSKAAQRAPKSGFHCSFTCPPVTAASTPALPSSSKVDRVVHLVDVLHRHIQHPPRLRMDRQEARIGRCRSSRRDASMMSMIRSYRSAASRSVSSNRPDL